MNKYIQKLIKEQFNINDLDFSDDEQEYNPNIFNKTVKYIEIYNNILQNKKAVTADDIRYMNILVSEIVPKNKDELKIITEFYSKNYPNESLNWICVSRITDMSDLFKGEYLYDNRNKYNGDISMWDTSNVTNMYCMFSYSFFNQPIGEWDVSNVTNMEDMFFEAWKFNQPIGEWDVSNVTNMHSMFYYAKSFNQPIGKWDVSNVTDMSHMFEGANTFNQNISNWYINDNTDTFLMYYECLIKKEYKAKKI